MSDSSKVTVNYFCVGALLIFVGCVLICSLGFTIVLPYELTKNWPEVKCRVLNSSYNPHLCSCEEGYGGLEQYHGNGWMHNRMNLNMKSNDAASNLSEGMFEFHDSFSDRFFHHPTCSSKFPCLQILVEYYFQAKKNDIKFSRNLMTTDAQISEDPTSVSPTTFPATSMKSRSRRSFDDRSIFTRFSKHKNHKYHSRNSKVIKRSLVDPHSETTDTTLEVPSTTDQSIPFTTTSVTHDVSKKLQKRGIAYLYRSWDDSFHSRVSSKLVAAVVYCYCCVFKQLLSEKSIISNCGVSFEYSFGAQKYAREQCFSRFRILCFKYYNFLTSVHLDRMR